MTNRYIDYKKNNDNVRADVINILVKNLKETIFKIY